MHLELSYIAAEMRLNASEQVNNGLESLYFHKEKVNIFFTFSLKVKVKKAEYFTDILFIRYSSK